MRTHIQHTYKRHTEMYIRRANTHTHTHTHTHTLPFLLRSNLLVSIPLSLLSLSPTGPEIINLFLHSSYVSTIPPPSCYFFPFLLSSPAWFSSPSLKKCTRCVVYFVAKTKRHADFPIFFFSPLPLKQSERGRNERAGEITRQII